jgi:hypothetical protein
MMHHPYVLEKLAHERRDDLLREADVHRLVRQVQREHPVQASLLKHVLGALDRLLNDPDRREAEQGSFSPDKAVYR